ncbi:sciellin isoform 2-T3 [Clarias gariepinus]|uniref:sciellin isoform X2 n=1 Tax=Clarias gariepinus TaxID=13013 RepID=UPI00234DE78F|nr:sciellin isoform X2 [Clarias gariepinus]
MTSTSRKSYPPVPDKGKYSVTDDSKKKTSLLKDNSWIKKEVNDDENSNFGKAVLGRFKSTENIQSSSENSSSTVTTNSSTATIPTKSSVQSLTKRFSTSHDDLDSSSMSTTTLKSGTKTTTVTTSRTSVVKSPTKTDTFAEKIFTDSRTSGKIQTPLKPVDSTVKSVTKTGTVTVTSKDSTVQDSLKPVKPLAPKPIAPAKSTKTETFTVATSKENTVQVDSNLAKLAPPPAPPAPPPPPPTISPSKNTKTETVTVTTFQDTIVRQDSKTAKSAPPMSPTKSTKTETVTVTSFKDTVIQEGNKSAKSAFPASPTKSITRADEVFDNLLPTSIKSTYVSDTRNDKSSGTSSTTYTRRSYTDSRPEEYFSESVKTISSPLDSYEYGSQRVSTKTYTSTTYSESRPDEFLDTYTSRSLPAIYTSPDRKIVDKDLCTHCQKPMLGDPKMILEDMDIRCHANCFKCDVCKSTLGHLKAGDSMWVYRRSVQCEACFGVTKSKWHR